MRNTPRLSPLSGNRLFAHVRSVAAGCLVATIALAACGGSGSLDGGSGGTAPGAVTGTLAIVPASAPLTEVEPNDSFDEPQPIGELTPGRTVTIHGAIGEGEGFDGFAFVATPRARVEVELRLLGAAPNRRVELAAYDPLALGVVARGDTSHRLAFTAGGAFDLVVRGAAGSGQYELVVRTHAAPETITSPGWMGAVSVGDALRITSPEGGRFELTAAEALDLRITAEGAVRTLSVGNGGDGDASAISAGAVTMRSADPLERIAIELAAGASVTLNAVSRTSAAPLLPSPSRLQSLERERAALGLAVGDALYGRAPSNAKAGELLVKARTGANLDDDLAQRGLVRIGAVGDDVLQVSADLTLLGDESERARVTTALGRSLGASPRVEYAELNRIRRAYGGTTPFTPNDTFIGLQWHYPLIRLPEAWGEVRQFITAPGTNVVVGVIDTGRRPHSDLNDNTLTTGFEYDFITDPSIAADGNGPDSNAFDEGDGEGVVPSSYHGTHVAGTIAAVSDNGMGVAGVGSVPVGMSSPTSRVKVVHLRVLGKGGGTDADIARAIRYSAGLTNPGLPTLANKLDIVNLSLGGPGFNSTVQNAVTAARNNQVVVLAAAGNENSSAPSYPAAYANVISVSAVDRNSVRAPYSNFHPTVDVCAPGGDASIDTDGDGYVDGVLSTLISSTGAENFVFYQGTSMACPHAAGLAALIRLVSPMMAAAQVETILTSTATDLGVVGRDNIYGFGLINAFAAVQAAGTGASTMPVLVVSPSALNFAPDTNQLSLALSNGGNGTVDVQTFTGDQPWVTLVNGSAVPGIDIGSLRVTIDRSNPLLAANGTYGAIISITTSNAGNVMVPVTVVVSAPFLPDVDLFVLAIDLGVDPPETVAQTIVNPAFDGLDYSLDELSTLDGQLLPPGDYLIVCGSDENDDGFICGDGDVYCGLYPTLSDPALVRVSGDVAGIDFVVAPIDSGAALTALSGGAVRGIPVPRYARLRAPARN